MATPAKVSLTCTFSADSAVVASSFVFCSCCWSDSSCNWTCVWRKREKSLTGVGVKAQHDKNCRTLVVVQYYFIRVHVANLPTYTQTHSDSHATRPLHIYICTVHKIQFPNSVLIKPHFRINSSEVNMQIHPFLQSNTHPSKSTHTLYVSIHHPLAKLHVRLVLHISHPI